MGRGSGGGRSGGGGNKAGGGGGAAPSPALQAAASRADAVRGGAAPAAPSRPSPLAQATATRAAKGPADQRSAALRARLDARVQKAEVAKRKDLHDASGRVNTAATAAQKANIARLNRTLERADAQYTRIRDAASVVRRKAARS